MILEGKLGQINKEKIVSKEKESKNRKQKQKARKRKQNQECNA